MLGGAGVKVLWWEMGERRELCFEKEWSQYTSPFQPTFKLRKWEKKDGENKRIYGPQSPLQPLLASAGIPEATKTRLRAEHAGWIRAR